MTPTQLHEYLERLANLLRRETRLVGADYGLQPVQWEVLHYLGRCNRYSDTPQAVTEYLGSTKGTVSQTLKVLEKKELVIKELDTHDKRVVHLALSSKGRDWLDVAVPAKVLQQACEQLPSGQLDELGAVLQSLLQTVQRINNYHSFGVCRTCRYNLSQEAGFLCGLTGEALSESDVAKICREHQNEQE